MTTNQGAVYVTDNAAQTWKAAVQETVDATLNRTVSSGESPFSTQLAHVPLFCPLLVHAIICSCRFSRAQKAGEHLMARLGA